MSLASLVLPVAVRLRRDFGALLRLIEAHAILQQASRMGDPNGAIVADIDDYRLVRSLVVGIIRETLGQTVPTTVRETVEAVSTLTMAETNGVSAAQVGREIGIDPSAPYRRCAQAADLGYLRNLEDKPRRPGRYVSGEPLSDDIEVLPDPLLLAGTPISAPPADVDMAVAGTAVCAVKEDYPRSAWDAAAG